MKSFFKTVPRDPGAPLDGRAIRAEGVFALDYIEARFEARGLAQAHFAPKAAAHRPACRRIANGRLCEPHTHEMIALLQDRRPGDMVHAGAFFGDMLPSFGALCRGTVFAFEPVLESYVLARHTVDVNGLENVILFNAALSAELGAARISSWREDTGAFRGGGSQIAASGALIPAMTIDGLGRDAITLIQLDVEGHEPEALAGARATIARSRPAILVEDRAMRCADLMREIGYVQAGDLPALHVWAHGDEAEEIAALTAQAVAAV